MDQKSDDYRRGEADGAKAGTLDEWAVNFNPFLSPFYREGFKQGKSPQSNEAPGTDAFERMPFLIILLAFPFAVLIQNRRHPTVFTCLLLALLTILGLSISDESRRFWHLGLMFFYAAVGWGIGREKGRAKAGLILGFALSIVGWLVVMLMKPSDQRAFERR